MELGETGREGVEEVTSPRGELSGLDVVYLERVIGEGKDES